MRSLWIILAAALGGLPGCHTRPLPTWTPRSEGPCAQRLQSPALQRQRVYLAALLALDKKGYVVLHNEFPDRLVGHYVSAYHPETYQTRWVVQVTPSANLDIGAAAPYDRVHDRADGWYRSLVVEIQRYQCRELEWLSWKAESLGLLPIGADIGATAEPEWDPAPVGGP